MITGKFGIKFVPHAVVLRRGGRFCHVNNLWRMSVILPPERSLRVRFVKGGLMYATLCLKRAKVAKSAPMPKREPVRYAAPVSALLTKLAPAPANFPGRLTAIEQTNRLVALRAAQATA